MNQKLDNLPHWDLAPIFPSLDSKEYQTSFDACIQGINRLKEHFDTHAIRRRTERTIDDAFIHVFEATLQIFNCLMDDIQTLSSYINCHVTTDATNDTAKSQQALFMRHNIVTDMLSTRFVAWIGSSDVETLLQRSASAQAHRHLILKAKEQASHQMSEAEETLASELKPSGLMGWVKLHGELSARMMVKVALPEGETSLAMSQVRALANHSDRAVRKAGFEAEITGWEGVAVSLAAALNGVKGYQQTVRTRRAWANDVAPTLLANSITQATLDAMQQAVIESFPDFRRYMLAKAKHFGTNKLAWWDLTAPLGEATRVYSWEEGCELIKENFARYSQRLADYADRTFQENWVDAEPRSGKQGGAYCTGVKPGISRLFMNYDGSFNSVSTLAHELGHGYHNFNLKDKLALQRGLPSTLAETASIFCETLVLDAALNHTSNNERLAILDTLLIRNLGIVVDIHSRFLFEQSVFERRKERELTISEFNSLMTDAQRATYGDAVDPLHPYMWAVKGHYYGPTFYNYPYTFGLLFGLGLYAIYLREPDTFRNRYDEFLSDTGTDTAVALAARFNLDIETPDFWRASLDVIRHHIDEFVGITPGG